MGDGAKVGFMRREGWADSETAIYTWEPGETEPTRLYKTTDLLLDCQATGEKLLCVREQSRVPRQILLLDPASSQTALIYDPNPDFSKFALGRVERLQRSEERRVGNTCVSTCRARGAPHPKKKKK